MYDYSIDHERVVYHSADPLPTKLRVKAMRESFGNYIVARQQDENLHKPLQVYKDDYVIQLLNLKHHSDQIRVVINTHASDLKLFNIGGL
jgi:hypothetical protein